MRASTRNKISRQTNWPVAYRWAAMGTLVAYSAVGSKTINVARAQDVTRPGQGNDSISHTQGSQPVRRFDIPAGTVGSVLTAFEHVTGLSVTVRTEDLRTLASPGVSGIYTADQALQKLLADTVLTYRFTSATAVSVDLKSVLTSIEVTTSVDALAAASPKYSEGALDTPQTITAVPQEVMQQQGVTTLRDALRNVAGISLAAGEGGAQGDNLTIRGFAARNDLFIDGMRDFGSYYRDPFNTQEVEVLQGPSSVTFGRGSTGGVVNQSTKTPGLSRFISGDLDFGTDPGGVRIPPQLVHQPRHRLQRALPALCRAPSRRACPGPSLRRIPLLNFRRLCLDLPMPLCFHCGGIRYKLCLGL